MKTYLRIAPNPSSISAQGYVQTVNHLIEWVGSRNEASADYLQAAQATQQKLKLQLGIDTAIEEVPSPDLTQAKCVIYRVEPLTADSAAALAQLVVGKTAPEAIAMLHAKGLHVAYRFVDGALTYPVYTDPDGKPAHGTGTDVAKARLDVQDGTVVAVEFFPEDAASKVGV